MALIREEKIGYYTLVPFAIDANKSAVAIRVPHPTDPKGEEYLFGAAAPVTIHDQKSPTVVDVRVDPGREAKAFDEENARNLVAQWNRDIELGMIPSPGPIAALPNLLHPRVWREAEKARGVAQAVNAAIGAPESAAKDARIAELEKQLADQLKAVTKAAATNPSSPTPA